MDAILTEFERTSCRGMLRYHCGQDMFCKSCGQVLDCRKAVEMDFYRAGELVATVVRCAACYDQCGESAIRHMNEQGLSSIVTDGRTLFADHPEGPAAEPQRPRVRSKAIEPVPGRVYLVRHSSGTVRFRFHHKANRSRAARWGEPGRAVYHFIGTNLRTGKTIELKSRARFIEEVSNG